MEQITEKKWQQEITDFIDIPAPIEGRCQVLLAWAQTVNGSVNELITDKSTQVKKAVKISGAESMLLTHTLRREHNAILIGSGTLLVDNPQLTVRHVPCSNGQQPQPIIIDPHLHIPVGCHLLEHPKIPWIVIRSIPSNKNQEDFEKKKRILSDLGVQWIEVASFNDGSLDLRHLCQRLYRTPMNIKKLMVEGGPTTLEMFHGQGLVDMMVITIAPKFQHSGQKVNIDVNDAQDPTVSVQSWWKPCGDDMTLLIRLLRSSTL